MPVTIYEVAERAGVGIGTVSRVLNNSPQISPETRAKVLKAIKEMNYQPHAMARNLARRRTHTIGAIVPFFTGYFYVELLRSIQTAISRHKYDLVLYGVDDLQKKEHFFKHVLQQRRVDGVLLVSMRLSDLYSRQYLQRKLPLVLVDAYHPAHVSITVNNEEGACLAVRHLLHLGHRHIAMINGHSDSRPAQERRAGYLRALQEAGLTPRPEWILSSDALAEEGAALNDGFNKSAGELCMRRLLAAGLPRPAAVFVASDIQAVGAIRAIQQHGLRVPQDIAVVGFDDVELAELIGLTTMKQPISEMGELAVERLMVQINGEPVSTQRQHRFDTRLVVRDTCGAKLKSLRDRDATALG
ncbi:MAG: LacI family transcriptional regulator [candidate division KSB1 bacterium]|nr:LacI family transcriptional regulator [candidate division KSB1 bacterium]MDZ7275522.1 LacI family transcriptional regulator [candidate division KSB1 bacterium]MDZ7286166.1 LacI family transcriptional regulator [candidate division KSB1 bacterium]MDZ7296392.1 LacI family transcriptional regulator [candidate division KSB1 bacterium]MDZ7306227.1 LacI family transcriptional regulator [candidate division KSB1 bacterium]